MAMRRAFMIADENDTKSLTLPEFIKFCHDYRIPISGNEIKEIFGEFDSNRNGEMNYLKNLILIKTEKLIMRNL